MKAIIIFSLLMFTSMFMAGGLGANQAFGETLDYSGENNPCYDQPGFDRYWDNSHRDDDGTGGIGDWFCLTEEGYNGLITGYSAINGRYVEDTMVIETVPGSGVESSNATTFYTPSVAIIDVGDTIIMSNNYDSAAHTYTSTTAGLDTGLLSEGWQNQFAFDIVGEFEYSCTVHPWMIGTIIVVDTPRTIIDFELDINTNNTSNWEVLKPMILDTDDSIRFLTLILHELKAQDADIEREKPQIYNDDGTYTNEYKEWEIQSGLVSTFRYDYVQFILRSVNDGMSLQTAIDKVDMLDDVEPEIVEKEVEVDTRLEEPITFQPTTETEIQVTETSSVLQKEKTCDIENGYSRHFIDSQLVPLSFRDYSTSQWLCLNASGQASAFGGEPISVYDIGNYVVRKEIPVEVEPEPSEVDEIINSVVDIPDWVKHIFIWYGQGLVDDETLIEMIQYLVSEGIIQGV